MTTPPNYREVVTCFNCKHYEFKRLKMYALDMCNKHDYDLGADEPNDVVCDDYAKEGE